MPVSKPIFWARSTRSSVARLPAAPGANGTATEASDTGVEPAHTGLQSCRRVGEPQRLRVVEVTRQALGPHRRDRTARSRRVPTSAGMGVPDSVGDRVPRQRSASCLQAPQHVVRVNGTRRTDRPTLARDTPAQTPHRPGLASISRLRGLDGAPATDMRLFRWASGSLITHTTATAVRLRPGGRDRSPCR